MMIQLSPYLSKENKPKKEDLYKLDMDKSERITKKKLPKVTNQDMKVYEAMMFNKK